MSEIREGDGSDEGFDRRGFLRRGGLVAGGAALGAAAVGAAAANPAGAQVSAQAVDYTYFPVGPTRTYDSRSPSAGGALPNGGDRPLLTGLHTASPRPVAITINLTVTQTVGAGWLAVYPGDVAFSGTSSINWFGNNQDLANNAFVSIPDDGVIRVRCGGVPGAKAQFIIDFIGASAPVDYGTTSAAQILDAYGAPWTEG
jgi:hypothetical protein